ncbi:hypothetical protein MKW94_022793 [Papaver nudicaule]|uniref:Sulfotransferase n=1 Tax=Papaver nudicaule TaxID=74823 RepID=A0AA41VJP2_PAPNU|nr:hypothetical protein [Papaver nudicaule]
MAKELAALLMVILTLVCASSIHSVPDEEFFTECENIVQRWANSSLDVEVKDKHTLLDLLFFLHIPRTGGRAYNFCFLNKLYTSYLECPSSYDKLHFDPSIPLNRWLQVVHDDYSITSKLPMERRTSVMTILRNPVDHFCNSKYIGHIWPWKYLVPWMREDLFARRDRRNHGNFQEDKETNNAYDMKDIVIPLEEFIHSVVAYDIIHNGATFQIAGVTNNSYLEAPEVRNCAMSYQSLGKYVLEVAKKRLDNMLYVGLTEQHKESATIFADVVGKQVFLQLQALRSSFILLQIIPVAVFSFNIFLELLKAYDECSSTSRKIEARRRTSTLKRISLNFSKEARLQVPEAVLQTIISLNSLDMELYKHAQHIFEQQKYRLLQERVQVEMHKDDSFKTDSHESAPL